MHVFGSRQLRTQESPAPPFESKILFQNRAIFSNHATRWTPEQSPRFPPVLEMNEKKNESETKNSKTVTTLKM